MERIMVTIREEKFADIAAREVLLDVAYGAVRLTKTSEQLREGRLPAAGLSLVATDRGRIVGTVRLWNIDAGPGRSALLLGPLAVDPQHRNRGIGSALMRRAVARARLAGHRAIILVGDAAYYSRFDFASAQTGALWMPGRFDRDRLLALELSPAALAGARGLISATGRPVPAPDLAGLPVEDRRAERARARQARAA
jgi:predicted N-acetyltransferase YhbS